ncbi:cobalt-precorrin-5B (C(1))-methyltransferase [Aquimarina hainanensis]|uniref:Cobalt-precorrin-5B C(1)-methyltransferase n=1 Tax=Aquimarina hainanensis TaxID=1578017 RepID=A0ABW5NBY4_9FLAO|nr:cobalt-precorrin-5B (C(1))-methyltransferase [Aquimarina sp. TRL1]QKX07137.1 cobalt-precorrin-5B (C(1))-methyltransferase [Aquimarina sp. TRL1]
MSELRDIPDRPLRRGYTTGACATACTKAALLGLVTQQPVEKITIELPVGEVAAFYLTNFTIDKAQASCSTIKDAGDDPDVTHLATIQVTVELNEEREIIFRRGEGVGIVTLPGLEIAIGEPAINPVPRRMMETVCKKILSDYQLTAYGVTITVGVKDGEKIAKRTLNSRLGILKGISILGTSGIVTPFSASSYIASIEQGIDVAVANNATTLLINSGARSEKMLKSIFPTIESYACIHYGNWIRETFEKINSSPEIKTVYMGIMLGKAAKLAQGQLNTHSGKTSWDKKFIYELAIEAAYEEEIAKKVLMLNMAGRLQEIFTFTSCEKFYQLLLQKCYNHCIQLAPNIKLSIYLINAEGTHIPYSI